MEKKSHLDITCLCDSCMVVAHTWILICRIQEEEGLLLLERVKRKDKAVLISPVFSKPPLVAPQILSVQKCNDQLYSVITTIPHTVVAPAIRCYNLFSLTIGVTNLKILQRLRKYCIRNERNALGVEQQRVVGREFN